MLNKITFFPLALSMLLGFDVLAKDPHIEIGATMCQEGEVVYISCALDGGPVQHDYKGAVASICAKKNVSPDQGYVQYRYGIPSYGYQKQKLELQYPEKQIPPKGIFKIYISSHPESYGNALVFQRDEYIYSFESLKYIDYRVVVRLSGRKIFDKRCTLPGKNYLIDKTYQGIESMNTDKKIGGDK